jgi:hypothetical protein
MRSKAKIISDCAPYFLQLLFTQKPQSKIPPLVNKGYLNLQDPSSETKYMHSPEQ